MKFYSTSGAKDFTAKEVLVSGLAPDGGLYLPDQMPNHDFSSLHPGLTFSELSSIIAEPFVEGLVSKTKLLEICNAAFNFPVEITHLTRKVKILELFHGPTLSFKDFGARFMARLFGAISSELNKKVLVMVATSGDTGSAVAQGFYQVPGLTVCVLYPKDRISKTQEHQIATLKENILSFKVEGSFDDCQRIVKESFKNTELSKKVLLTSANSINFFRLLPQVFYYWWACYCLKDELPLTVSVPSGNFGNITAALLAKKTGAPIKALIAATNANNVVPRFLESGSYNIKETIPTISNAMDVGAPSNFERLKNLLGADIKNELKAYWLTDDQTKAAMRKIYNDFSYVADPHTAVGIEAALIDQKQNPKSNYLSVATAHPIKFPLYVEPIIGSQLSVPKALQEQLNSPLKSIETGARFESILLKLKERSVLN